VADPRLGAEGGRGLSALAVNFGAIAGKGQPPVKVRERKRSITSIARRSCEIVARESSRRMIEILPRRDLLRL
jgi:hypothetical protein